MLRIRSLVHNAYKLHATTLEKWLQKKIVLLAVLKVYIVIHLYKVSFVISMKMAYLELHPNNLKGHCCLTGDPNYK